MIGFGRLLGLVLPRGRCGGIIRPVGRSSFTEAEIAELRRLVREKQTAERSRQKALRARMRRIGFYISDFSSDAEGFVVSDLDELVSRRSAQDAEVNLRIPALS